MIKELFKLGLTLMILLDIGCATSRLKEGARLLDKSSEKKPEWISKIPQDRIYLYAIGVKAGASSLNEGIEKASANAAAEIVSVVGIKVKAKVERISTEISDRIRKEIKTKAKGVELDETQAA